MHSAVVRREQANGCNSRLLIRVAPTRGLLARAAPDRTLPQCGVQLVVAFASQAAGRHARRLCRVVVDCDGAAHAVAGQGLHRLRVAMVRGVRRREYDKAAKGWQDLRAKP